jgi:hypothetical protein
VLRFAHTFFPWNSSFAFAYPFFNSIFLPDLFHRWLGLEKAKLLQGAVQCVVETLPLSSCQIFRILRDRISLRHGQEGAAMTGQKSARSCDFDSEL